MKTLKKYLALWARNIPPALGGPFTLTAGAASIASFFGVEFAGLRPELPWLLIGMTAAWILWQARPNVHLHPSDHVNKHLKIADLDKMLVPIPRIALLGSSSVGKSTFMSRASHMEGPTQETAAPYAVIVAVPDRTPVQYVALVDTVGRKYPSAAAITANSDAVVVFVDNSDGSEDTALRTRRAQTHREIARSNINPSLETSTKCRYVVVVANKSDLWEGDGAKVQRMAILANEVRAEIAAAVPGKVVETVPRHSNNRADDVSSLIRRIRDHI